ncbi:MAG: type II toxin-antitoxin system RelB/DinJ family antitoxin [Gammaproteobacteria bacterium]|nr:type II toxin-antitoxin system RelB/DinJ family antitoxin [Gammaproteobacteria bacterium]
MRAENTKTAFIRARIEPALKARAEHVLDELGITPTQAIHMLYKHLDREHAWPLPLKIPNAETRQAFEESDKGIGLTRFENAEAMFKKLGI